MLYVSVGAGRGTEDLLARKGDWQGLQLFNCIVGELVAHSYFRRKIQRIQREADWAQNTDWEFMNPKTNFYSFYDKFS